MPTTAELLDHGLVPLGAAKALMPELKSAARGVPLRNREGNVRAYAMVDAEDYERVNAHRWYRKPDGYVVRNIPKSGGGQQTLSLHRFVMGYGPGDSEHVDHRSHDLLDHRKSNLRVGTHAQNHQNRRSCGDRGSSSKYRGVSWSKAHQRWIAYAMVDGKQNFLGHFMHEDDAGEAAAAFRAKHMPFSAEAAKENGDT